jgi:hypothetical protein
MTQKEHTPAAKNRMNKDYDCDAFWGPDGKHNSYQEQHKFDHSTCS